MPHGARRGLFKGRGKKRDGEDVSVATRRVPTFEDSVNYLRQVNQSLCRVPTTQPSLFPEQATGDVKYVLIYDVASVCSHDYWFSVTYKMHVQSITGIWRTLQACVSRGGRHSLA